uniref:Phospholipase B-like n=1 Tax=Neobodo designis TaxID=312471 RepID=A0A7S1LEZ7_NEODS|mmetsp:Transcript_20366/g.63277  ORF Transcript_20366/g.63277 Transcript_20366/m.63277 type:complete len:263 (+) Transcript_20366:40-828(+)
MRVVSIGAALVVLLLAAVATEGAVHAGARGGDDPGLPLFDEQFTATSTEYSDFFDGPSQAVSQVSVVQTFAWDLYNRRSHMTANGSLVGGYLEQLTVGIIPPNGTVTAANFWQVTQPTGTNTPTCLDELMHMGWSNFWGFGGFARYLGQQVPPSAWVNASGGADNVPLDAWVIENADNKNTIYQMYARRTTAGAGGWAPVYYGVIPHQWVGRAYHFHYQNYVPGPPDASHFAPPTMSCTNVTSSFTAAAPKRSPNVGDVRPM